MANRNMDGNPRLAAPTITDTNQTWLMEQLMRLAPYYTPEWRFSPEDPDPGSALFLMFSRLLEGNLQRLNQVPYKSFLAFLNRFHVELAEARSALAPVTLQLTDGSPEAVYVEQGLSLAAHVDGEPEPVPFETLRPILVTPAKLTDLLSVSPARDWIARLAGGDSPVQAAVPELGTALFGAEGRNLQEHALYIRHDPLFLLRHPAYLEFAFTNSDNVEAASESVRLLADSGLVKWEFYHAGEWRAFHRVYGSGSNLRLIKIGQESVDDVELNGEAGRWIRCRADTLKEQSGANLLSRVQFDQLAMKSEFAAAHEDDGMLPDLMYSNDLQLDTEEGCLPFGDRFAVYGLFYMASEEAFSKRGAEISIRFDLAFEPFRLLPDRPPQINWKLIMKRQDVDRTEIPDPVTIAHVQWEYWNGASWMKLPVNADAQKMFSIPWEGKETRRLTFTCPEDLARIVVNAEENYWIRGRIVQIQNPYSPNAVYYAPRLERLRIRFGYEAPRFAPQRMIALNNLEWQERTPEIQSGGLPFRPFRRLDGRYPAVWFGFDSPPVRGPISFYLDLVKRRMTEQDMPYFEWEYLKTSAAGPAWSALAVSDETDGFTKSGCVQFIGPRDYALHRSFGQTRYWIRAVNRDGRYDDAAQAVNVPRLLNLYANTTLAVQQQTVMDEYPRRTETFDDAEGQVIPYSLLAQTPVLSEEVWVDETGAVSREELERFSAHQPHRIQILRDSDEEILRVWIRYAPVPQFLHSGPGDRHYLIDRSTGRIRFGDGRTGRKPPNEGEDRIRVTYKTGGGDRGNVPAGAVSTLLQAVAFLEGATNPLPAAGGCDAGSIEEAIHRGPKLFTHRNRAVTAADFEWLARGAHPNVAKVRCLPNLNVKLERQTGALTLVVLPRSGLDGGAHFQEMKRTIEEALLQQASAQLAFPGNLQVMEPAVLEIGLHAVVWVKHMEEVVPVEREILRKVTRFLDPIAGNIGGQGWEIGDIVHPSMFYALLKSVGPVNHIPQLAIQVVKVDNGRREEWHPDRMAEVPHGIIVSGEHRIRVELHK